MFFKPKIYVREKRNVQIIRFTVGRSTQAFCALILARYCKLHTYQLSVI